MTTQNNAPVKVDDEVFFDPADRALITTCTKCKSQMRFRLGPIASAEVAKQAIRKLIDGHVGGPCPIRADGGIAPAAHFELGYWGYWQAEKLLKLIDLLVEKDVLEKQVSGAPTAA